jgi:acyl-CoA thioesterase-1
MKLFSSILGSPQSRVTNGAPVGRHRYFLALLAILCSAALADQISAVAAEPIRIVAFGDSLTAGYGLQPQEAFPAKLSAALKAKGYDVSVANAGVSGDTTTAGLARLDWSVPNGTQAVILEFGANDAFRGVAPATARKNLEEIVTRLKARNIEVMLAGMYAPRNLGQDYVSAFNPIYPDLAKKYGLILVPFFLDGVAGNRGLNLPDGIHPTAEGVDIVVKKLLPSVEALIQRLQVRKAS